MTDDQYKWDLSRVTRQNQFTDLARGVEERPRENGLLAGLFYNPVRAVVESTSQGQAVHDSVHGPSGDRRTNFESRPLNEMIDLVERTNPEDLESSGKALWDARDAIKAAADELSGHIDKVQWAGKSGDAFRKWGSELVTQTHSLSSFAGGAGDQITAAAMGLASVRSAMPPRDTQLERKHPTTFTAAEKVANKDEYAAAVRVEKDRQEAINQMNRLSSYYVVSKDELAALNSKAPEFTDMPNVGVPRPQTDKKGGYAWVTSPKSEVTGASSAADHHATVVSATGGIDKPDVPSDVTPPAKHTTDHVTSPDVPTHTNIDSVGTLPPATTVHNPPVTGVPAPGGGPANVFKSGFETPIPNSPVSRSAGGFRTPFSAQGRSGTSGLGNSGAERSAGRGPASQMGRATETGRSLAKGTASGAKSSPMGRGVTGGVPRSGGTAVPRANGGSPTGAGRSNGVVGGRPTSSTGGQGKGGARIPRGNVIGAEEAAGSRSTGGRPGQRGVFGAPETATRPGQSSSGVRGGTGTPESVTATPTQRKSLAQAERNGM
ncbi:WXG100 family type VII secretion target, partial [Streptomyces sp. MBT62]|uniref:WXG100 family type VII secretion target n=1 Tax=Streptomyces sp. MBT62 TaxID=2800410 RepID=UPI00190E5A55